MKALRRVSEILFIFGSCCVNSRDWTEGYLWDRPCDLHLSNVIAQGQSHPLQLALMLISIMPLPQCLSPTPNDHDSPAGASPSW